MTRKQMVTTVAAALVANNTHPGQLARGVSEWLSEHPGSGSVFDAAGWVFWRFVADVSKRRGELIAAKSS